MRTHMTILPEEWFRHIKISYQDDECILRFEDANDGEINLHICGVVNLRRLANFMVAEGNFISAHLENERKRLEAENDGI